MRFAVFVFSFYLVFAQMYSAYAIASVGAVAIAGTLRGAGSLITRSKAVKNAGHFIAGAVTTWCLSKRKECLDKLGDAADVFGDLLGDDVDGGDCMYRWRYMRGSELSGFMSAESAYSSFLASYPAYNPGFVVLPHEYGVSRLKKHEETYKNVKDTEGKWVPRGSTNTPFLLKPILSSSDVYHTSYNNTFLFYVKCGDDEEDRKQRERELFEALKDKLSDDEVTNIVNNYGDNIGQYCESGATCIDIDIEFGDKINNEDYDSDKIDDKCEMRNGKIVSCEKARRSPSKQDDDDDPGKTKKDDDDDGSTKPKKDDDDKDKKDDDDDKDDKDKKDDDDTPPSRPSSSSGGGGDDDDPPINCDSSTFHKKICDWLDWTQEDYETDEDTKVKIDEEEEPTLDKNRINFNGYCPSPETTMISYAGVSQPITIRYDNYCAFFIKLKPLLIGVAGIISVMIISGRKMGS